MSDIIQLLPESVANQIAAGEVIQRPASVVKELVENAIDAGGTHIVINIKDAGRTLVQVIDNGSGMSDTDARMSFERHATSKIRVANDLFALHTMGFRGEALASIAAVAHVELKTRLASNELGTHIVIASSEVQSQVPVACAVGTNFSVKNLFFNVPVRRKFLKSNQAEFKHITDEIKRVALSHPDIHFVLHHNDAEVYNLPSSSLKQRIINIFGKNLTKNLTPIATQTSIISIEGFIGKPEFARKTNDEQYFFINRRYMRHPYFHKAVMSAFEPLLASGMQPSYFIYMQADPNTIDVNIHPTKTEIKFEDSNSIYQILRVITKEALGKFSIVPSIDFDTEGAIDIPTLTDDTIVRQPSININTDYNPFEQQSKQRSNNPINKQFRQNLDNWDKLYLGFERENNPDLFKPENEPDNITNNEQNEEVVTTTPPAYQEAEQRKFLQLRNRFIVTPVKSGLMIVHQQRAYERILFEQYVQSFVKGGTASQQQLFPQQVELSLDEALTFGDIQPLLEQVGFKVALTDKQTIEVRGIPTQIGNHNVEVLIRQIIELYRNDESTAENIENDMHERVARSLAQISAIGSNRPLTIEEMRELFDRLFACQMPNYSPQGKVTVTIVTDEQLEERLFGG